ncbi:hypothetical protein KEJ47_01675 [Candidatus Bathyarchaeota archaeon]|nr:hypothetical protein [Candidatus Bathyarchaeota archaeon]
MPQQILCSECGFSLYEGDVLKSPQDIIKKYDGKCPNCKKKLVFDHETMLVTSTEGLS